MTSKEEARRQIADLAARFQALGDAGRRRLTEAETKTAFIEPLFEALGWDVRNPAEVGQETHVSRGRADYAFRLDGTVRFYLEAKPPRADLSNPEYAQQAITYAFYQGVRWAILTDFEELYLFNADWEAGPRSARFLYLRASDYVAQFDRLWLLSRNGFLAGELDGEASRAGATSPRIRLEEKLFAQLRQWREELFTQIRQRNSSLSLPQVDEAIMRLFNRLIFVRNCEDRQLEERRLISLVRQRRRPGRHRELMVDLQALFREFDGYYDSDLFAPHLIDGKGFFIEAATLEQIIEGLYRRPGGLVEYDFEQLPADVLGAVYEQYLGYVTREAKKVLEREQRKLPGFASEPTAYEVVKTTERRKAQGIYYTPAWVVDYIVRQTVGRYLAEHTPDEVYNMTILDPACGSGSFLVRAYEELLRYWAEIQGIDPRRNFDDRIPILRRNIFGVDLDDQAVQIARLNLLLRALAKRDILPPLTDTIRRGNSLISGGEAELRPYFGDAWREKRPFTWEQEFPNIMARSALSRRAEPVEAPSKGGVLSLSKGGGFDVVIGNPPYVRHGAMPADEKRFYGATFKSAFKQYDIYVLFIEAGIRLLRNGGRLGFIVSSKFFASDYGARLRKLILDTCAIESVINVSELPVFKEAAIYPYILVLRKEVDEGKRVATHIEVVPELQSDEDFLVGNYRLYRLSQARFAEPPHILDVTSPAPDTIDRMQSVSRTLGSMCKITRGFRPPPDDLLIKEDALTKLTAEERSKYRKMVDGRDIKGPYELSWKGTYLDYQPARIPEAKPVQVFESPKVMITDISYRPEAYFDPDGFYCPKTIYLLLAREPEACDLRYITGIINSKLSEFFFRSRFYAMHMRGGYLRFRKQFLDLLPIRRIDFANPEEKALHDRLVALVERMLELHRRQADKTIPQSEREDLEREIARADAEIDTLVYDLYGLTEAERRLVEEATSATR